MLHDLGMTRRPVPAARDGVIMTAVSDGSVTLTAHEVRATRRAIWGCPAARRPRRKTTGRGAEPHA